MEMEMFRHPFFGRGACEAAGRHDSFNLFFRFLFFSLFGIMEILCIVKYNSAPWRKGYRKRQTIFTLSNINLPDTLMHHKCQGLVLVGVLQYGSPRLPSLHREKCECCRHSIPKVHVGRYIEYVLLIELQSQTCQISPKKRSHSAISMSSDKLELIPIS